MPHLCRGDVVALRRGGAGIVWHEGVEDLWVVPLAGANGIPRHRAEIRLTDADHAAACGATLRYPVVLCQMPFRILRDRLKGQPIGRAPESLLEKVIAGIRREMARRQEENRMHFADGLDSPMAVVVR